MILKSNNKYQIYIYAGQSIVKRRLTRSRCRACRLWVAPLCGRQALCPNELDWRCSRCLKNNAAAAAGDAAAFVQLCSPAAQTTLQTL